MRNIFFLSLLFLTVITACKKNDADGGPPPSVKGFWPNSGNPGTIVTINGAGFNRMKETEVLFNGVAAQIMDLRDTAIKVLAPAGGTSGMIAVQHSGQKMDVGQYTFQSLSIATMSPANGPAGTNISIRGMGFSSLEAPAKVFVNDKEAIVTAVSDTLLVAAIPTAAGSGKVKVVVAGKEVSGPDFLFQNIAALKPMTGGVGTSVKITGEGFNTDPLQNHVAFNGKAAKVLSAEGSSLVVEAPEGVSTGPVSVTINGQQTVGSNFTVIPPPVVTAAAPLSGPVGTEVTIRGENFSNFTDEVNITFNNIPATVISATTKMIVVKVPANAGTGEVKIDVNDQLTSIAEFKEQNLGVAQISPDNGMDGDVITVTGVGFSNNPAENTVSFNGTNATVTSATGTELKVTVPSGVSTGQINVTVGTLSAKGPVFNRAGVMTLAGGPGNTDLQALNGITVDSKGNVFVATGNNIKKITPAGVVTLFAGSTSSGNVDGAPADARFNYISGLAIDVNDDIYVSDQFNSRVRKVTPAGIVSTAGTFSSPMSIASDPLGNIYLGQMYGGVSIFNKVTGAATKPANSLYESAAFIAPLSPTNFFYAADYDYYTVFRFSNNLKSYYIATGNQWGYMDGTYATAQFNNFSGLAVTRDGNTIYALNNGALRRATDNTVTTLVGQSVNGFPPAGFVDGGFSNARFSRPKNICLDRDGNLYVADVGNNAVRKVFFK
jgi:hypothetical protein